MLWSTRDHYGAARDGVRARLEIITVRHGTVCGLDRETYGRLGWLASLAALAYRHGTGRCAGSKLSTRHGKGGLRHIRAARAADVKSHAGCNVSTEHRRDAGNWPVAGGLRSV